MRDPAEVPGVKSSPRPLAGVAICACASLVLYQLVPHIAAMLSSARPSYASEVFPWVAKVTDDSLSVLHASPAAARGHLWFFLCFAALFALYAWLLRLARNCGSVRIQTLIFFSGAIYIVSLLFAPVMLSTDVFAYAFYGRVLQHGANPYAPDASVTSDPFFALFNRQSLVSLYGPLWTLLSSWFTQITGDRVGGTVLLFRGFSALMAIATGALIWRCLRIHAPGRAAQGLVMFLWNPLLVLEAGLSGHNDTTMVALAALAVWLHFKGWKTGAAVAFTLSALIKFITGMLVPLYILMVLRGMNTWRERILFLLRCGAAIAVTAAAILIPAHVTFTLKKEKSDVPATSAATSPAFYANNFHELIFHWLRARLGENSEPLMAPTDGSFEPWFAVANKDTFLRAKPPEIRGYILTAPPSWPWIARIPKGRKLITITPTLIPWLRVYDSGSGKLGYVYKFDTDKLPSPGQLDPDPMLAQLNQPVVKWPSVVTANKWIRIATWALFAAFGLLAAWKSCDIDQFLVWSAAALLASYYLIMTQMWPWYILWALAFGALRPERLPARLAVLLSACVLSYYITLDYDESMQPWVYTFRSLPAIVLPGLIFLATLIRSRWGGCDISPTAKSLTNL